MKMSKKLILVLALSLVLASGALFSAQADCGCNFCSWHLPSCFSCGAKDMDRHDADRPDKLMSNGLYDYSSPWPPGQ